MVDPFPIVDFRLLAADWPNQQSKISNQQCVRLAGE